MCELMPVAFHGDTLYVVSYQDQPYVPMRPIIESLGLGWASQTQKLKANQDRWSTVTINVTVASDGKRRDMICLPLRKLPGWLMTLQPSRITTHKRERVIQYQNECDDVLWNYWSAQKKKQQPAPLHGRSRFMLVIEAGQITSMDPIDPAAFVIRLEDIPEVVRDCMRDKMLVDKAVLKSIRQQLDTVGGSGDGVEPLKPPRRRIRGTVDAWEPVIAAWLDAPAQQPIEQFTTADILTGALRIPAARITPSGLAQVGLVMARLGWRKARPQVGGKRTWVFVRPMGA